MCDNANPYSNRASIKWMKLNYVGRIMQSIVVTAVGSPRPLNRVVTGTWGSGIP